MTDLPLTIDALRKYFGDHPEHKPTIPNGPGLGLGGRMGSIAAVSAMMAIEELGITASAIQSSVYRELRPDFIGDREVFVEYAGIGDVALGHTGMSIYGQFLEALRERISRNITAPYVADADHVPLYSDSKEDLDIFRSLVTEARDRSFFTIDPHFCVNNEAGTVEDMYDAAIKATGKAATIISEIKRDDPYVIEFSVDECPGLTSPEGLRYLVERLARKTVELFSIAPSIGFDKKDSDGPEVRKTLRTILPEMNRIAKDNGLVLGIHSGDGKSDDTLKVIGEITEGNVWYRISPDRQRLYFKLLADSPEGSPERKLFEDMFEKLLVTVREGARYKDPEFAQNCQNGLTEFETVFHSEPNAGSQIFFDFAFLLVREFKSRFDALNADFIGRFFQADLAYIRNLAVNLFLL